MRSPISAIATVEREIKNASMSGLRVERRGTTAKPPTAPAGGLAVGLAMLESPVRHGLESKYVDVRPGQAGRLLPKTASFVAVLE